MSAGRCEITIVLLYTAMDSHKHQSVGQMKYPTNLAVTKNDNIIVGVKVGFHYPSSRAELTARELGCIF